MNEIGGVGEKLMLCKQIMPENLGVRVALRVVARPQCLLNALVVETTEAAVTYPP